MDQSKGGRVEKSGFFYVFLMITLYLVVFSLYLSMTKFNKRRKSELKFLLKMDKGDGAGSAKVDK